MHPDGRAESFSKGPAGPLKHVHQHGLRGPGKGESLNRPHSTYLSLVGRANVEVVDDGSDARLQGELGVGRPEVRRPGGTGRQLSVMCPSRSPRIDPSLHSPGVDQERVSQAGRDWPGSCCAASRSPDVEPGGGPQSQHRAWGPISSSALSSGTCRVPCILWARVVGCGSLEEFRVRSGKRTSGQATMGPGHSGQTFCRAHGTPALQGTGQRPHPDSATCWLTD